LTSAERLAAIYGDLVARRLPCLVLGGHAVRYYGIGRNTVDYDFHVALAQEEWRRLPDLLAGSGLLAGLREGPSWRPQDFRRFVVGTLADGRDEYLECWRRNHLLAPFDELQARHEAGPYGGRTVAFLGLADLIRSKETERESDWQDVALLEEIADLRALAAGGTAESQTAALASLRSRRGLEEASRRGWLTRPDRVADALRRARNPISLAYLIPSHPAAVVELPAELSPAIAELLRGSLRTVPPASARHLALVEAVRRLYKRAAMEADRADKEAAQRT
jgi:hypothetical protein